MNLIRLAWKNIIYKPWSTALSIVLFALGIGLVSLLFLIERQLEEKFEKNLAGIDLVVGAKGSPLQLILSSMYHIDAPTGNIAIHDARPFLNPNHPLIGQAIPLSLGDSHRSFRIVGTTHDFLALYDAQLKEGEIWTDHFQVVIGSNVAELLDMKLGDAFKSSHGFLDDDDLAHEDAESFKVVGILKGTGSVVDQLILCSPQSFWYVHDHEEDHDHEDDAIVDEDGPEHDGLILDPHHQEEEDDDSHLTPIFREDGDKQITSLLLKFKARNYQALNMQRNINENTELQAATPAIEINRLFSLMSTGEQALRILAFVIVLVSGLSIFISLYSSLRDRRYEMALMRVSGASRAQIFLLILAEGILLAAIGYTVGIAASHLGMQLFASEARASFNYDFSTFVFLREEFYLLVGAICIGIIAAILPAIQAARTDIAETLTGEQ